MANLISSSITLVEPEWQKHWKLLARKPVITEPEKKVARARPRRKTSSEFDCSGLPEAVATVLREFAGPGPSPQDTRYRVALACRDYLSAFYELAINNSVCNKSKEEANQKAEGGFLVRRNRRNLKGDWMQDAFEELVGRYDREQELGRRQRSNYAVLFNELGQKLQPCYPQFSLQAVHNYSRSPRHLPVTAAANLSIPPSYYDRIRAVLERDTLYPPIKAELERTDRVAGAGPDKAIAGQEETAHSERFARFALLLMLRLGVTFRGVVAAICRMELRDLNLKKGFVVVYHKASRRTWLPVWLDDLTALALCSLIAHRARNDHQEVRKRLIQPQSPRTLLATWKVRAEPEVLSTSPVYNDASEEEDRDMGDEGEDNSGDEAEETASSRLTAESGLEQARKAIEAYFKMVCQRAGLELPITLVQMLHTTRWVLNERSAFGLTKTGAVIAMLSGFIKPGFFTEDMLAPDWTTQPPTWLAVLLTKRPKVSSGSRRAKLAYGGNNPNTGANSEKVNQVSNSLSSLLSRKSALFLQKEEEEDIHKAAAAALRHAMCQLDDHSFTLNISETGLSRVTRRQEDNRQRRQAGKALRQLAGGWLGLESPSGAIPGHSTLIAKLKELYQNPDLSEYEINLASVVCWLAYLSAEQEGFLLRADTLSTYRTEALYLLKALPNTRITDYEWEDVEDVLEFDLAENPPIRRKAVVKSIRNYLSAQVGLPLSELDLENSHFSSLSKTTREKILTPPEVWKLLEGLEPERSNKERNLLLAVILGYFGMLRAGEICRLRCGDLVLGSSQPYVRIYNTKCRKSRIMPLDDLPDVLVALLKRLRRDRQVALEVAQGQRGWQRVIGEPLLVGETGQSLSPSRLSALVKERLKECGFGETSLHDFRKGGANWRYYSEANVPAADIGKWLGHSGLMVTFKCYLKGLDLVQREMAQKLHLMPQTVGISSPILAETISAPTEEWTLPVAKLALLADVSRQQAYNLLDGRKLTLQVVRQILQQEVMSSIVSSIT